MKKITALILAIAILAPMLTGCAETLSGSYSGSGNLFGIAGGSVTFSFKGDSVTVSLEASIFGLSGGKSVEGTYKITKDEDKIRHITFSFPTAKYIDSFNGTFEFSEGTNDDGEKLINIGHMTFVKSK